MSDKLNADDLKAKTVDRGSDGEFVPVEHEIEWGDETKVVETVPISVGILNELSHIDEEIANLKPKAVHEAFETIYITPDPETFTVEDIQDLEFQYLEALMDPLDEQMNAEIGGNEN